MKAALYYFDMALFGVLLATIVLYATQEVTKWYGRKNTFSSGDGTYKVPQGGNYVISVRMVGGGGADPIKGPREYEGPSKLLNTVKVSEVKKKKKKSVSKKSNNKKTSSRRK